MATKKQIQPPHITDRIQNHPGYKWLGIIGLPIFLFAAIYGVWRANNPVANIPTINASTRRAVPTTQQLAEDALVSIAAFAKRQDDLSELFTEADDFKHWCE